MHYWICIPYCYPINYVYYCRYCNLVYCIYYPYTCTFLYPNYITWYFANSKTPVEPPPITPPSEKTIIHIDRTTYYGIIQKLITSEIPDIKIPTLSETEKLNLLKQLSDKSLTEIISILKELFDKAD